MVTAAYMRFGSAGVKSAFQKYVAEATGNGRFDTANKLVSTGSVTMLALSAALLIPTALCARPLVKAAGVPPAFLDSASSAIVVLALAYVLCNFGSAFEAIVMGGHRVDLTRAYNTLLAVLEAIAIVALLSCGYGLLGMTLVMAVSELIYICCCYRASRRVLPEMRVQLRYFSGDTIPELLRFAGSYQLVNILELLYVAVVPIVVLRLFGAGSAGVYAVAVRVVGAVLSVQDALILPLLSGASMVFASGCGEKIATFLTQSFRVTLLAAVPPLAFVSLFGPTAVFAWTGRADSEFRATMWLVSVAALLKAISLLQLILYRASGKALLDNIRQVLRLGVMLLVAWFGGRLGFRGVLAGMAAAELIGVVFMFFVMRTTFKMFRSKLIAADAIRVLSATVLTIGLGAVVGMMRIPWGMGTRLGATCQLGQVLFGCMVAVWPALVITKCISTAEGRAVIGKVLSRRNKSVGAGDTYSVLSDVSSSS